MIMRVMIITVMMIVIIIRLLLLLIIIHLSITHLSLSLCMYIYIYIYTHDQQYISSLLSSLFMRGRARPVPAAPDLHHPDAAERPRASRRPNSLSWRYGICMYMHIYIYICILLCCYLLVVVVLFVCCVSLFVVVPRPTAQVARSAVRRTITTVRPL